MTADDLVARFERLLAEAVAAGGGTVDTFRRMCDDASRSARRSDADAADEWHGLVGRHPRVVALRNQIERFAAVDSPVLIRGESGTGKDLVARILHDLGPRKGQPMVCENCAAIPETLLESVLFGHKKGSFTGAVKDHPGHFVTADGGTLFLDEIGDMPLPMQAKILRVLQEGEVRPLGSERVRKVDVRVVAATHRDLEQMVRERTFREDLFFRLNVLRLELPPLRDRGHDVVLLARRFLARAAESAGRDLVFSVEVEAALERFSWPGNVRQLQNEIQRLAALADGPQIQLDDLSPAIQASAAG
ncbi:MAG: sigma-54-dependent Fis family transcriptional regulator [Planctomycetes bacterium]|nr:sigma-54-dependent Fis family transcriptional regulator [Planctomycetota bacterium]